MSCATGRELRSAVCAESVSHRFENAMALNQMDDAVGEHKKRKRKDAKSTNVTVCFIALLVLFLCIFVFLMLYINVIAPRAA